MSEKTPTIWMNVTTSANWQRPPVGIVRVEQSLCVEFAKLYGDRFKQCIWQDNRFVEWSPGVESQDTADERNHASQAVQQAYKPELAPIFPILPKRKALVALAQGLLSLAPSKLQPYLNRLLHALRPRVIRLLSTDRMVRIMTRARRQAAAVGELTTTLAPNKPNQRTLFSHGDILISIGLDWDYPYYKQFYALRKNYGVRVVTCCYDLIPVIYPQYCVNDVAGIFTSYFLDLADGSDLIMCISSQSEKDLKHMLHRTGGANPPTFVFPLGDNVPGAGTTPISQAIQAICQEPFILFVSTIERRKNHEVLYRAYHLLCSQGKRSTLPKLVFVGMQGWGVNDLLKDIELDPLTRNLIVRMNHVSDAELRTLYETAMFCVFPSLYEGWGLPVGEALSMGKAVICSNRGSLPEVGGELVRYVDPWNTQAWADEIYKMATDEEWRRQWEHKAKTEYHTRSWQDAALSVKEAIRIAIGS